MHLQLVGHAISVLAELFTARRSYASAVLRVVILYVYLSVCLSVTRVLCDKTKQSTADIFMLYGTAITLVF